MRPKIIPKLLAVAALAASLLTIGGIVAGPATAAHNPCGTTTSSFAGTVAATATPIFIGDGAVLVNQADALCTSYLGDDNFASSWVMIGSASGSTLSGWSQAGQIYWYSLGCDALFADQEQGSPTYAQVLKIGPCDTVGGNELVWNQYVPPASGGPFERANINSTVYLQTSYNPLAYWTAPWNLQALGETFYPGSDIPGTPTAKTVIFNIEVQRWDIQPSFPFQTADCTNSTLQNDQFGPSGARTTVVIPSCSEVDVWTSTP